MKSSPRSAPSSVRRSVAVAPYLRPRRRIRWLLTESSRAGAEARSRAVARICTAHVGAERATVAVGIEFGEAEGVLRLIVFVGRQQPAGAQQMAVDVAPDNPFGEPVGSDVSRLKGRRASHNDGDVVLFLDDGGRRLSDSSSRRVVSHGWCDVAPGLLSRLKLRLAVELLGLIGGKGPGRGARR